MEKAVVDRIIDGKHVVLLVGNQELEKVIALDKLPDGVIEGSWLKVEFKGSDLVTIEVDQEETDKTKKRISSKIDMLRERSKERK